MGLGAAAIALATGWLVSGCTGYSPYGVPAGATVAEVVAVMGAPKAAWPRDAAPGTTQQIEFWRGPFGKHTYMLDFDANGRLASQRQVLEEVNFYKVLPGQAADEVLQRIGHPSETQTIGRQRIVVWNYRYDTPFCQWFQVSIGSSPETEGKVTDVGFGPDPMCTPRF
jgi:hypothetical protein